MMGLNYPGGPEIARLAAQGVAGRFVFPRPMCDRPGLDFSFSGLKTFALNTWQQCVSAADDGEQARCDISLAFQQAVVETDRKSVVLGKGVAVRVDLGGRRLIKKKKNKIQ